MSFVRRLLAALAVTTALAGCAQLPANVARSVSTAPCSA